MKALKYFGIAFGIAVVAVLMTGFESLFAQAATNTAAVTTAATTTPANSGSALGLALALLGAAFSTFWGGMGSSIGVGLSGEVAAGVLSEDEKKFGSMLLLQALPATQAIYGLVISFMVLTKISAVTTVEQGLSVFFAVLPVSFSGFISAIWQGKASAASMQLVARKPKQVGQAVILPAMVETFAVFGLLMSIFLLGTVK